jgi:hypothetical protein
MTDLTDVLHRATDDLAPESPDLLLARAVRRGAGLRRRRRITTGAAAVGGVAAACTVAALALGRSTDAAAPPPITDQPTTQTTVQADPPQPAVAVSRDQIGATFARIIPGSITDEHDVPAGRVHSRGGYESTFDWNGYLVSLMITPFDGSAHRHCVIPTWTTGSGQSCVRVPGGWSLHDVMMHRQGYNRSASVYLDNGFQMWVLIYNSGSEKGSTTGGPPPLDVPDLEKVATSPLWFG